MEAARLGRRAVVVTIDPARRLADALGLPDGLGTEPQQIPLPDSPGELWAMMLDTATAFDALVRRNAGDDEQAARILANPFYRNMSGALSGTQEYMAAETLHQLHADGRFDLVVVDTPPSRNALDFLEASGVLARFLDHRLFRLMMLPARGGMRVVNRATQPLMRAIGKVVGSAQLRERGALLQHGSILLGNQQELVGAITLGDVPRSGAAALSRVLGRSIRPGQVISAITATFEARRGPLFPLDAELREALEERTAAHRPKFLDPAWTWRR
jgi:hypothetical protein